MVTIEYWWTIESDDVASHLAVASPALCYAEPFGLITVLANLSLMAMGDVGKRWYNY